MKKSISTREDRILFIPGWMDKVSSYGPYHGLEIWDRHLSLSKRIRERWIVGYSIGANFALLLWRHHRKARLMLINPLFPQRSLLSWLFRWVIFLFREGFWLSVVRGRPIIWSRLFSGLRLCICLLSFDPLQILREARENTLVLRGDHDTFFCDREAERVFEREHIAFIRIAHLGHTFQKRLLNPLIKKFTTPHSSH